MADQWGSDVPLSMPRPLPTDLPGIIPMGGFTMTRYGLFPDLSAADHERLSTPAYAPLGPHTLADETVPDLTEDEEWQTTAGG